MPAHMDLSRARALMSARRLDALVACTPENVYYTSGHACHLFELYRLAPMALALIPARADVQPALIVPDRDVADAQRTAAGLQVSGYPVWTETLDLPTDGEPLAARFERLVAQEPVDLPAQYDRDGICRLLAKRLAERSMGRARIGIELDFLDANTFSALRRANPDVEFVDSTDLLYELRMVKNPAEIAAIRHSCALTDAGIAGAARAIRSGSRAAPITRAFEDSVWSAAEALGIAESLGAMDGSPDLNGPTLSDGRLASGCTVKFDAQVRVSHYFSDVGRTFVVGSPLPEQQRIYDGLMEAHERAREQLRPGARVCDVFQAALEPLRRRGFRRYSRGHFGHSIGLDPKCEEPPFVSANETRTLVPGMILSIETPFYCRGFASIQLEDVCLITADGHEVLTCLPRELVAVDVAGS